MTIKEAVAELDPPRYTTSTAAELIGRSEDTMRRWREDLILVPSDSKQFGNVTVPLYTPDDIEKGKMLAAQMRPGRKSRR